MDWHHSGTGLEITGSGQREKAHWDVSPPFPPTQPKRKALQGAPSTRRNTAGQGRSNTDGVRLFPALALEHLPSTDHRLSLLSQILSRTIPRQELNKGKVALH